MSNSESKFFIERQEDKRWLIPSLQEQGLIATTMEAMVAMLTEEATMIPTGNFSSRAKAFDHILYEDCCENSPYDIHKGYHGLIHDSLVFIAHDVKPWNICDSLGDANHCTFCFLENNSYGFDGSLFSLLGDNCVKFQEDVVERFQYVLTSLDTYVKNLVQ
ncbi:hypothetical protein M9H77_02943 [Catharanthus roseus]|uniref:Uncharacterized protein n=1 Tax=Catharanthus roseus TaxID=4058 RepID=A0ACC0CA16_CATRO|nr:hypothetical protein M9H77_02943 [Catharanthus roseus]